MVLRKKEHHQDRGAIEAVEQAPGRIRQDGLVEQRVVGLEGGGNEQDNLFLGVAFPAIRARSISRPDIPNTSVATFANLMLAVSSTFSRRLRSAA